MSDLLWHTRSNQGLRALDPDLPVLASEAAIDIEILLSGGKGDLSAIKRLAERLNNSIDSQCEHLRSLMDHATISVLNEALAVTVRNESLQRVEDLMSKAMNIFRLLSDEHLKDKKKELEQARDFCVALSRAAMAYRKSIRDLSP